MALRYCVQPGCRELVRSGRCRKHAQERERARPLWDVRRWYRTQRWAELRARVLERDRDCVDCGEPSTDVDHKVPHRGDPALFWAADNLEGRCHRCHSRKTAKGE